jgi:hypothetical protein
VPGAWLAEKRELQAVESPTGCDHAHRPMARLAKMLEPAALLLPRDDPHEPKRDDENGADDKPCDLAP